MNVGNVSSNSLNVKHLEKIMNVKVTEERAKPQQKQKDDELEAKVPKDVLQEKVESMNEFLIPTHTSLKFQLHDQSEEYYVQVVDDKTKEVIREIPDRKFLDMYAAMAELVGIVVDEKI